MKNQVVVGALIAGSFLAGTVASLAFAQHTGSPDLRMGVTLSATPARAVPCGNHAATGCFRLFMEARASASGPKRMAFPFENAEYYLQDTFAYLEDGGICHGYVSNSVPRSIQWSNGGYTLPIEPETISAERPYSFPLEFRCDQPIQTGEKAQIQVSIAVGNGDFSNDYEHRKEEAHLVRFKWPEVTIGGTVVR
ncbi:MAG: hypothetical protein V4472_11145 [Pseudomonadota bacterium]